MNRLVKKKKLEREFRERESYNCPYRNHFPRMVFRRRKSPFYSLKCPRVVRTKQYLGGLI